MNAHIAGRNVVVTVAGPDGDDVRKAARKVACAEAHTALIGKLLKVAETRDGHVYTWGPVTTRQGAAKVAPAKPAASVDDLVALEIAELRARLAELTGEATATVKAPREAPAFVRAARERREAAACKTCTDHGVVRAYGKHAGHAYKTANGASAATVNGSSKPCEARGCKSGKAARKARKAA